MRFLIAQLTLRVLLPSHPLLSAAKIQITYVYNNLKITIEGSFSIFPLLLLLLSKSHFKREPKKQKQRDFI